MLGILAWLQPVALGGQNPPDAMIEDAILIDVPREGFEVVTGLIPAIIPTQIPLDSMSQTGGFGWCPTTYTFEIENMWVTVEVQSSEFIPQDGYIDLTMDLLVQINDTSDPFGLFTELICIDSTCDAHVEPFEANVLGKVYLELVDESGDGSKELDATISDIAFTYDLDNEQIILDDTPDCLIENVEEGLNVVGLSLYDMVLGLAGPALEGAVNDAIPDLEESVEEAFAGINIDQDVDVGGTLLHISISPSEIDISTEGLRMVLNGGATSETVAACIAEHDPGGSLGTEFPMPALADLPANVQIGATVGDDFVNQAMYSLWRSGLMCFVVDESVFALDTSMLNLLSADAFVDLFPSNAPMYILTRPRKALELDMDSSSDIAIAVEELGIEFYAELDHRSAMILSLDLDTQVGVDVPFDSATGALAVDIELDTSLVETTVSSNDFVPESSESIEDNFADQLDTILGIIDIESLLGDLSFQLPSFNGFGLVDISFAGVGTQNENIALYADLGPTTYTTGCDSTDESGCGGGGCEGGGGCAAGGVPNGRSFGFLLAIFGCLLRRNHSTDKAL
jgi:hypothetical protein